MEKIQVPEKLYFKIGEVSKLTKVKPYVLRYWENEFKLLKPNKSRTNQRVYTRRDVFRILEIKRLIYKEKFTLEGVKKKLRELKVDQKSQLALPLNEKTYLGVLKVIRKELYGIKRILEKGA